MVIVVMVIVVMSPHRTSFVGVELLIVVNDSDISL